MKIGYPCINTKINCTANSTFRLKSYSEENLISTVSKNLVCLKKILEFNLKENLFFFRIGSPLIPFASHPVCVFDWKKYFRKEFQEIGDFIKKNKMRISMHPDQFVVLNSLNKEIVEKSIKEIEYHCDILDSLGLSRDAKVQIHVGGVYRDKEKSKKRFIQVYKKLSKRIKEKLVIENDHHSYSLKDCLEINKEIGIPIVFDAYHHECLNNGESFQEAVSKASKTWKSIDGKLMVDYSNEGDKKGSHSLHIDIEKFSVFLSETKKFDFDIMFEIKDKEKSALKVVKWLQDNSFL